MDKFTPADVVDILDENDILKFGRYILQMSINELNLVKEILETRISGLYIVYQLKMKQNPNNDRLTRLYNKFQKLYLEELQSIDAMLKLRIEDEEKEKEKRKKITWAVNEPIEETRKKIRKEMEQIEKEKQYMKLLQEEYKKGKQQQQQQQQEEERRKSSQQLRSERFSFGQDYL